MRVLAFDCSSASGSIAVTDGGVTIHAERFECPRGRGGEFFPALQRAINACGKVDRVGVGIGPGSYNGLRAAAAAAEGLRIAMDVELAGIPSVCALPCDESEYVAVSDARGGVFYHIRVRERKIMGNFELLTGEELIARVAGEPAIPIFAPAPMPFLPGMRVVSPDAVLLARLAADELHVCGGIDPLYLKPAHITKPKRGGLLPRHK